MKLQAIKQNVPTQENIQPLATNSCQIGNPSEDQKVAYFVLKFEELLGDIPVVVLLDLNFVDEVKSKYPEGSFWSIGALEKFISDPNKRDLNLWKAVNLAKSVLKGRVIK